MDDSLEVTAKTRVFVDTLGRFGFPEVENQVFKPLMGLEYDGKFKRGKYVYWLELKIINRDTAAFPIFINAGNFDSIQVWHQSAAHEAFYCSGSRVLASLDRRKDFFYSGFPVRAQIVPGGNAIYCRLSDAQGISPIRLSIFPIAFGTQTQVIELFTMYFTHGLFLGILFFVCLFTLAQYAINRELSYLYYAFYLFCLLYYFWSDFERWNVHIYPLRKLIFQWLYYDDVPLAAMTYIAYMLFLSRFLDARNTLPRLYKVTRIGIKVVLGYLAIALLITAFFEVRVIWSVHYYFRLVLGGIGLMVLYQVYRERASLSGFILTGTFCLLLGIVASTVLSLTQQDYYNNLLDVTLLPVQIGILLEIFFFSTGLGYKSKVAFQEKEEVQQKHIQELRENEKLRAMVNESLQTELAVLRNQLKPHFLFNSLNAIKNLIVKQKPWEAERYLIHFARLMREVLTYSDKEFVSLEEELAMCERYLQMEQLRFRNQFYYHLDQGGVDTSAIFIPPLILQPFLENAILHGLLPKPGKRELHIRLTSAPRCVTCTIEDNGIGRAEARRRQQAKAGTGKGMKISRQRIRSFNHFNGTNLRLAVIDKTDDEGKGAGTRIDLIVPK